MAQFAWDSPSSQLWPWHNSRWCSFILRNAPVWTIDDLVTMVRAGARAHGHCHCQHTTVKHRSGNTFPFLPILGQLHTCTPLSSKGPWARGGGMRTGCPPCPTTVPVSWFRILTGCHATWYSLWGRRCFRDLSGPK